MPDEVYLDFSGVKPFEPLEETTPEGKKKFYLTEVTNVTLAKGPKGPYAVVEFTVTAPPEGAKRKLFRNYSFTPESLPFLHEFVRACNPEAVLDENFAFRPADYIGSECAVTIENREYEEQIRSGVKKVHPAEKYQ